AELCCSRAVADSGTMSYEKQVGLTGKTVSPKIYVAFGISGAVQHTCAIAGAETVIAVNKDKNARIFDYADYGIIAEV
ncbi:MAG: FAD-binding protein, partial [Candidatus Scatosoma sp.]